MFVVLLPLALGFMNVLILAGSGLVFLGAVRQADLQLSLFMAKDRSKVFDLLRKNGRADEILSLTGLEEYDRVLALRAHAKYLVEKGNTSRAIELFQEASDLVLKSGLLASEHTKATDQGKPRAFELADTLNDYAAVLQDLPDCNKEKVESLYEEAVRIGRASVGKEDPQVTVWIMNLGIYKQQQMNKLDESLRLYEEVLEIRKSVLGDDDALVAQWMVSMAYLLLARPDCLDVGARIESLVQDALAIRRRIYGNDHVEVASSLNDCALMAALTAKDGDEEGLQRARKYGVESAEVYERVLGKNHQMTIKARADWGT